MMTTGTHLPRLAPLMPAPALAVVGIVCMLPNLVSAQPAVSPQIGAGPSVERDIEVRPVVRFAGGPMTRKRAATMVEPNGWTLVDFHSCGRNDGSCVELTVVKRKGGVFRYVVLDERCLKPEKAMVDAVRSPHQSAKDAAGMSARAGGESGGGGTTTSQESHPRDLCIAGKRVSLRSKQENLLSITPDGDLLKFTHVFQKPVEARWRDAATLVSGGWTTGLVTPPGGHDTGTSYEVYSAAGDLLGSGGSARHEIAASGGDASTQERCAARAERIRKSGGAANTVPRDICQLIDPDVVSIGAVEWEIDFCASFINAVDAEVDKVMAEFMDKCLANPDLVLTATDPDAPVIDVARLVQFKTPGNLEGRVPAGCADFTASNVSVDMGGDQVCTADVRFSCGEVSPGNCECEATSLASPMVCHGPAE